MNKISTVHPYNEIALINKKRHGFLVAQMAKNTPTNADLGSIPGSGRFPWRRKWQPTPVFLSEKSHRQRSLTGYRPQGHKELDRTEQAINKSYLSKSTFKVNTILSLETKAMVAPLRELFSWHSFIQFIRCPSYAKHAARCVNQIDKRVNEIDKKNTLHNYSVRNCGQWRKTLVFWLLLQE